MARFTSADFMLPMIRVRGRALDPTFEIFGVDVRNEAGRVPRAEIELAAGRIEDGRLALEAAEPFVPGAEAEIAFRSADREVTVFKGVVVGLNLRIGESGPVLGVELKDKAIKLTQRRRSRLFEKQSDADAIMSILREAGLRTGTVPTTEPNHDALVQANATDWDFILTRAEAQGLIVVVSDGTVALAKMAVDGAAAHRIALSDGSIAAAEFEFDVSRQQPEVVAHSIDLKEPGRVGQAKAAVLSLPQGGVGRRSAGGELDYKALDLSHMVPAQPSEMRSWANARMARSRLALIRGRISSTAMVDATPMQLARLEGLGDRFSGDALITGVRHRLDSSGFRTDLQFGLSPEPFGLGTDIVEPPAAGLIPAAPGLQLGVVTDIEDPEKVMRVKVRVPAVHAEAELWARLISPDAGNRRGLVFRPEVGDEVVVAFVNGDPRHPIVLGSLHGSKHKPPDDLAEQDAANEAKGIVTRNGLSLVFTDSDKPSLRVTTPAGGQVTIDDGAKTLTLTDQSGNKVELSDQGVSIVAKKDLKIEASGKVTIKGQEVNLN